MTEENKNYTETEIMLGALDRVVREEMKKKPSKRDNKLIDECIAEMAKLKNVRAGYTEEEIGAIVEKLEARASGTSQGTPVRRKKVRRMAAMVCAICLIMGGSIAAVAWNPFEVVKDWILEITLGTIEESSEITYTNHNDSRRYNNIHNLLKNENLDVYYPSVLPESVSITKVELLVIDNKEYIKYYFNNADFEFIIQLDAALYLNTPGYETIKTNDVIFYLSRQNDKYIARCNINSNLYLIECSDYEDILTIINSFTK